MKKLNQYLVLILPLLFFVMIVGLDYQPIADEYAYFVTSKLFGENLPSIDFKNYYTDLPEFKASNIPIVNTPPLSIVFYGLLGRFFGFDLWKFRILTMIFGAIMVITFYSILNDLKIKEPLLKTLLVLFYPYIFLQIFTAQTDIITLTFFVISLKFFLRNKGNDYLFGAVFSTLAIYMRQDYLFVAPAIVSAYIINNKYGFTEIFKNKKIVMRLLQLSLPIFLIAPLFIYWGGLFPPPYMALKELSDEQRLTISFEKLNFFFVLIGALFVPLFFWEKIKLRSKHFLILALVIISFIYPLNSKNCEGIICKVGSYLGAYSSLLYLVLLSIGAYIFINNIQLKTKNDTIILSYIVWLLLGIVITTLVRQRYYLPLIPLLTLMLYKDYRNRVVLLIWTILMLLATLSYVYYKVGLLL